MSSQKEMTFFKRVGAYELGSTLGQGSFATVYRGQHRGTKRIVAVKAIVRGRLNQKLTENLEAEISILQTLQHTNVVRLHDVQTTERHVYLVMEFCPGGDLSRFIRSRGAQSEPMARGFLLQLAEGLRYLRSHNLIHRDLKPQNLLLSSLSADATLKIADFGFARYMQQQDLAETLCGSPLYMAPEILRFQKYDAKADLWSVGAIMYELLTARPPFTGANHVQLLKNIESSSAQLPPQLTQPCQRLLSSLLQREPTERLSFEAFFADPFLDLSSPKSRSSSGAAQPTVEHGARLSSDQERGELRGEGVEPRAHATAEAVAAACKASASSATAPPHHPAAAAAPAAAHVPSAAAGTGPAAGAASGGAPPRSPACAASTRAAAAPPVATSAATSAATAHAPPSSRHSHGGCDSRPMASQPFKPMASPPFKPMASPPFKPMASPPLGPQQHAPFVPSMQRAASTPLTPPHKTAAACTAYACAYSAHHASQKAMHHAPQGTAAASGQHPYPNPGLSSGHSLDHATSKESAPPHSGPSLSSGPATAAPESLVHAPPSAAADAALSRSAGEHSPHSHLTRLPSPRDGPFAGAAYDHLTTPVRKSPSPTAALLASPQQMTRSPPPAPPHSPDGPLPFSHLPPPALPPQVKAPATHLLCSPATATLPSANAITASMLARRQILPVQLPSPATLAHAAFPHAFSPDSDARVLHAPNAHTAPPPFQSSVPSGLTIHTTSPMLYDKSLDGIDHEYVLISTPNSPPMMAVPSAAPAAEAPDARDRAEWPGLAHPPDAGEAAQLGAQHAAAAQAAEEQRQLVSRAMAVAELAQDSADGSTAASDESFTPVEALALHVKALDLIQQCLALQSGDCAHGNAHNTTLTLTPTPTPATVPNTAPNTAPNTLQTTLQTTLQGSSGPGPALRPSEALLRLDGERCVAASCLSTTDESCSADALRARFAFLLQSAEHIRAQLQHERESSALAKGGQTVCVEEILYRHALIMGREAAVDELLGKLERSCLLYQRAKLLLEQLAHEAEVGQADRAVLSKYAAGFAWRLYEVATKRAHAAQLGDDG